MVPIKRVLTKEQLDTLVSLADTIVGELSPDITNAVTTKTIKRNNNVVLAADQAPFTDDAQSISEYLRLSGGSAHREELLDVVARAPVRGQHMLRILLNLLSTRAGTFVLTGHTQPFKLLSRNQREAAFLKWKDSSFASLVSMYKAILGLSITAIYRDPTCKVHAAVGYPVYDPVRTQEDYTPPQPRKDPYTMQTAEQVENKHFDVIIIGTGAGGGVSAAELSKSGYSVLLIEKSKYLHESELKLNEREAYPALYEQSGAVRTEDGGVVMVAGSAFGGGTTVNYSVSLKLPYTVREEWAKKHGLPHFISPKFSNDLDRVYDRIGASTEGIKHNGPNKVMINGCRKLGYNVFDIPQNTGGHSHECGWCYCGCSDGIKNGTMNTWLRDAEQHGARFLDRTKVLRVLVNKNNKERQATGVECLVDHGDQKKMIRIYAKRVISSAGSLHTPGVLQRSGLVNSNIGRNLRLHPGSIIFGFFDEPIDMHMGSIVTTGSEFNGDLSKDGYGLILEIPTISPSFMGSLLPWRGSFKHKQLMLRYRFASPLVPLLREHDSVGTVNYDENGDVSINYDLTTSDRKKLVGGLVRTCLIMCAAGAREIHTGQLGVEPFVFREHEEIRVDNRRFQRWINRVEEFGLPTKGNITLVSAHQLGTCRMGNSPDTSATKPTGETWEVNNLYVADASLFPTASGVNPMVTTEAIAIHVAANVVESLKNASSSSETEQAKL
ncbi:hypothetical protein BDA99DRAFT_499962 [Phascolomyces articulosus]|uniref:Long-chain-alcohol oxidase n=1 Tax=Phascolomyces articulosus TaxID=60185 RepID=A0AAD5PI13_9FUNG|nr:hypothetical protein BDA99DRAFT_499962 [Phascolomyces articulosus]